MKRQAATGERKKEMSTCISNLHNITISYRVILTIFGSMYDLQRFFGIQEIIQIYTCTYVHICTYCQPVLILKAGCDCIVHVAKVKNIILANNGYFGPTGVHAYMHIYAYASPLDTV